MIRHKNELDISMLHDAFAALKEGLANVYIFNWMPYAPRHEGNLSSLLILPLNC